MEAPQTEITIRGSDGEVLLQTTVTPGEYVLGRDPAAELHFTADLVSRRHALLTVNFDHLLIEDLGSSNGTLINGKPVAEATRLWPNQKVQVGSATLEFRRIKTDPALDVSLAPAQAAVRRLLPEEFLREKKYDIGSVVAHGGMGAILDAREATIERRVAMKVMLDGSSPDDLTRFITEAKITGQLEHPGIVPIYELGVDENGQVFYTMKFVRGITLKKVLELMAAGTGATIKKYPLAALLTIFQKVCDALAFAHSRGVIHRDLKPENIMIGDFGEVMVMDWGLAKVLGQKTAPVAGTIARSSIHTPPEATGATMAGTIMGTPAFMSPEQARGEVEDLDTRSDIYALGAILYQILALRPPVTGRSAMEIVDKVGRGEVEPLISPSPSASSSSSRSGDERGSKKEMKTKREKESHLPGGRIPDSLAAVVRKAMAFDRDQRYWTVEELQRDLAAYQSGFATSAEKAGTWKQFTLFVRRNKTASIGLAAVLLVGATFGTKAVIEGRRAEREAVRANRALTDLKKSAPALLQLAESEAGFQRFDSALGKLDAAIALDPGLTAGHWSRAWTLMALERWSEAATALTLARERDPAHAARANILPIIQQLAAAPDDTVRWTPERRTALYRHLSEQQAAGPLTALSRRFQLGAKEKEKLVRQRLDQWLGTNVGSVITQPKGDLLVRDLPKTIDTLEPLRGLPIGEFEISSCNKITSLEPLRGMPLTGLNIQNMPIRDLSPLGGMRLVKLTMWHTLVRDIAALRGMPLEEVNLGDCQIADYSPLQGAPLRRLQGGDGGRIDLRILAASPLEYLEYKGKQINDLAPLRGKPLRTLLASGNKIADLSPLADLPLVDLSIDGNPIADYAPLLHLTALERLRVSLSAPNQPTFASLRHHPTLAFIALDYGGPYRPVAEFWADYDAQQAAGKK